MTRYRSIFSAFQFLYKPFTNRAKLGEGGLVVFNMVHSAWAAKNALITIQETLFSLVVISLLYGLNDYVDRQADLHNPKKDQAFTRKIVEQPRLFLSLNILISLLCLMTMWLLGSPEKTGFLLLLFIVNGCYSLWFKSFVIADLIIVVAWGALFALLAGPLNYYLACVTGLMIGIAHIFQIVTDKPYDTASRINTSAVTMPNAVPVFMALLCLTTGIALSLQLGAIGGLSAVLPFLFYIFGNNISLSWHAARIYFFSCWLVLLITTYGSF